MTLAKRKICLFKVFIVFPTQEDVLHRPSHWPPHVRSSTTDVHWSIMHNQTIKKTKNKLNFSKWLNKKKKLRWKTKKKKKRKIQYCKFGPNEPFWLETQKHQIWKIVYIIITSATLTIKLWSFFFFFAGTLQVSLHWRASESSRNSKHNR